MERAGVLIKRLLEQYENNAGTGSMLVTAQMLLKELQNSNQGEVNSGKKVSVIIPSLPAIDKIVFEENSGSFQNEIIPGAQNPLKDETSAPVISSPKSIAQPVKKPDPHNIYSLIEEMPTFTYQQKSSSELNDTMTAREESLNDRLKVEKMELGSKLKDTPVKDLRKAIGINDRFVFINELFRGDEDMYERSIKTINSFTILPEAEYWIQRELKVKLGWNEELESVRHFDQLVRRRFS